MVNFLIYADASRLESNHKNETSSYSDPIDVSGNDCFSIFAYDSCVNGENGQTSIEVTLDVGEDINWRTVTRSGSTYNSIVIYDVKKVSGDDVINIPATGHACEVNVPIPDSGKLNDNKTPEYLLKETKDYYVNTSISEKGCGVYNILFYTLMHKDERKKISKYFAFSVTVHGK